MVAVRSGRRVRTNFLTRTPLWCHAYWSTLGSAHPVTSTPARACPLCESVAEASHHPEITGPPLTPSSLTRRRPFSAATRSSHHRSSPPRANTPQCLPPGSIPARARGSRERHRVGRRCHRVPSTCRGPLAWQTRRRLGRAVVGEWSVELAKPPQSRHRWRAFPQVRALPPTYSRTPRAGVAGSNPTRRTGREGRLHPRRSVTSRRATPSRAWPPAR